MTKKNSTIIVLTIMLISVFALNSFAFCERYFGVYLELVDIEDLILRGAAPNTEEAILDTRSSSIVHQTYVAMGCYICGDWDDAYGKDGPALNPGRARVWKEFDSYCWTHPDADDHCAAYYDVIIED